MSGSISFTVKKRRHVFQNSRFNVYADYIAAGSLEVADFLVVVPHCSRPDLMTGVAVVPLRGHSILLLRRYRHAVSQHVWELPRGFIDVGEDPASAAPRELAEETGLACPPDRLIDLGSFLPDPGIIAARVALFAATDCRPSDGHADDEIGLAGSAWHSYPEVTDLLRHGHDGASCLTLHRYQTALEAGRIK